MRDVRQLYDALEDRRVARVVVTDRRPHLRRRRRPLAHRRIPHPMPRCHHRGGSGVRRHRVDGVSGLRNSARTPAVAPSTPCAAAASSSSPKTATSTFAAFASSTPAADSAASSSSRLGKASFVFVQAGGKASFTDVCFEGAAVHRTPDTPSMSPSRRIRRAKTPAPNSGGGCTVPPPRRPSSSPKTATSTFAAFVFLDAGGRLGGFVFVQAGGKASFTPSRAASTPPPSSSPPPPDHGMSSHPSQPAAARAAVAGTTAIDDVALGTPHNVTFTKCAFKKNDMEDGDGGAAWFGTAPGLGVGDIRPVRLHRKPRRCPGRAAPSPPPGGRVIFAACRFDENIAGAGGALMLRDGGLIGGSTFAPNHALAPAGAPRSSRGRVPRARFRLRGQLRRRRAAPCSCTAARCSTRTPSRAICGEHTLDVYACSNADECGAFTRDTAAAGAPDPDPFASARRKTAVYERPTEREETGTYAGASATSDGIDGDGDGGRRRGVVTVRRTRDRRAYENRKASSRIAREEVDAALAVRTGRVVTRDGGRFREPGRHSMAARILRLFSAGAES